MARQDLAGAVAKSSVSAARLLLDAEVEDRDFNKVSTDAERLVVFMKHLNSADCTVFIDRAGDRPLRVARIALACECAI